MSDLKPCPFCGHETPYFERRGTPRQSCIIACGNCGCQHESSDEGDRCGTQWNERAAQAQSEAAMGEVELNAMRYVWLRDIERGQWPPMHGDMWVVQYSHPRGTIPETGSAGFGAELDAAIDAAIAAQGTAVPQPEGSTCQSTSSTARPKTAGQSFTPSAYQQTVQRRRTRS